MKGNEKNREDPRVPTDKDIKHAEILKMITQAVKKHRQNIGKEDAKLTIPRYRYSQQKYHWWVSTYKYEVLCSTSSPFAFASYLMNNL